MTEDLGIQSNVNIKLIQKFISNMTGANEVFIFSRGDGESDDLISTEYENWRYSSDKPHPVVNCFNNGAFIEVRDLRNNLVINNDKHLIKYIDRTRGVLWLNMLGDNVIMAYFSDETSISGFHQKIFKNISSFFHLGKQENFLNKREYTNNMVDLVIQMISKKDTYTGGHTKRVGMFAEMICDELNLAENEKKEICLAAMIHDLGKVGIPDHILKKSSPLTDDEFEIMKRHPELGEEILRKLPGFENIAKGVLYHHERPDGKGYPYGLKGGEIPLIASIVSLSDAFDAMISTRPYRKAIMPDEAFASLKKYRGTQFDLNVFDAFERAFLKMNISKKYREQIRKAG